MPEVDWGFVQRRGEEEGTENTLSSQVNTVNYIEDTTGSHVVNVYCDESCHLEYDRSSVMGFGAIAIEAGSARAIAKEICAPKEKASVE